MVGTSLGHYRILRKLGTGGMGEVYLAEDNKLKRQVALKILPPEVAADASRRERFQREAEAIAALDHPNIVTIHSIESGPAQGSTGDIHFITMQLVAGKTLTQVIPERGLPLDEFLDLAIPLADAMSAAHGKGITHRDLKPGNIMVGEDGRLRVLDFGLAKVSATGTAEVSQDDSTAATEGLTQDGTVFGTIPYMSPEQVRGRPADARSDVFSLGTVLYEMLAGQRPFSGETAADLMSAILRDTPPSLSTHRQDIPETLCRILRRCLEKAPDQRYADAAALHRDLRAGASDLGGARAVADMAALALPSRPSLAVLPFASLSDDPERDYFASGLWADINADLVKISGLFLISQTSTVHYKGKTPSPQEVGRELGVGHVLQGTVRHAGDRVRITAELVDTQTGQPVWGERYDRTLDDLFELQDEITEEIVTALDVKLVRGEGHRIMRQTLKDPRARDIYYHALESVFSFQRDELVEARHMLAEVAEIEPDSPLAHVFQAFSYYFESTLVEAKAAEDCLRNALRCADKAIAVGDPSGTSHMIKGIIHLVHQEHEAAVQESDKALEDRPNCPWAFALRGAIFNYSGKPAEAQEMARLAIRHTPLSPPLFPAVLATSHYLDGRHDEAAAAARRIIQLAPDNLDAHIILAAALAASGRAGHADSTCKSIRQIKSDFSLDRFAEHQPYKDDDVLRDLITDLRDAGLS